MNTIRPIKMSWKLSRSIYDKTMSSNMPNLVYSRLKHTIPRSSSHSTINQENLDVFTNEMSEWWNPNGKLSLLHTYNTLRVPLVRDGLVQCSAEDRNLLPLKDIKILDVGCGGGILSEALARLGASVTGIDPSPDLIKVADAHKEIDPKIANCKPTYIATVIEDHAKQFASYYNCVVASEVIEHVNNQELFVRSCVQAVKPGGKIFFTTPNRTRLSQLLVITLAEKMLKMVPDGAHEYEKFITPTELTFLLEKNDCHVESTYGVFYNPVSQKWSFISNRNLMYAIQAQKLS